MYFGLNSVVSHQLSQFKLFSVYNALVKQEVVKILISKATSNSDGLEAFVNNYDMYKTFLNSLSGLLRVTESQNVKDEKLSDLI